MNLSVGMPYLQYLGLDRPGWEIIGGELTCPNETSPHTWDTILYTIPLQIAHISLSEQCMTGRCSDREIWVSVKFTRNFPKMLCIDHITHLSNARLWFWPNWALSGDYAFT